MKFEKELFPFDLLPGVAKFYLEKLAKSTEAPDEFLATSFLAVSSALAGPHFSILGMKLNNFFLIVGSTSQTRKTTALGLATDLFRKVIEERPGLKFEISEEGKAPKVSDAYSVVSSFSVEGVMERALCKGGSVLLRINEYGNLFQIAKRQSQGNTITELTDLYDCKLISKRTTEKSFTVSDYALTILASSTKEWIKDFGSTFNTSGGFVNRHLVVTGKAERVIPCPEPLDDRELIPVIETLAKLIPEGLISFHDQSSVRWEAPGTPFKITLSEEAKAVRDLYYRAWRAKISKITNERIIELVAREDTHSVKLAAIRCVLDTRRQVNIDDLVFGARLARWCSRNTLDLIEPARKFDFGDYTNIAEKIFRYLRQEEPQTKTELAHRLGGKQGRVNSTLDFLVKEKYLILDSDSYRLGSRFQLQDFMIEENFGRSDIYEIIEKLKLETTRDIDQKEKFFEKSQNSVESISLIAPPIKGE